MAFLASQVGAASSLLWNRRLQEAGLESRSAMVLWNLGSIQGRSQRALAETLHLPPTRLVEVLDRLEKQGWIERRVKAGDRRINELYLTKSGGEVLDQIVAIGSEHEEYFARSLQPEERAELVKLLSKLAAEHGLTPRVHPHF